jgi:hypothetical protein
MLCKLTKQEATWEIKMMTSKPVYCCCYLLCRFAIRINLCDYAAILWPGYKSYVERDGKWEIVIYVGLEVLTAVVMKSSSFSSYTPVEVNRLFGGTVRFHLQGRRVSQARKQYEAVSACCLSRANLSGLLFNTEDGGDIFFGNIGWFLIILYTQNIEFLDRSLY